MKELKNLTKKQLVLNAAIADDKSPAIITESLQEPDVFIVNVNKLYVIELTVGFETRIAINAERKKRNFELYVDNYITTTMKLRTLISLWKL